MGKKLITTILVFVCSTAYADFSGSRIINANGVRNQAAVLTRAMEIIPSFQDITDAALITTIMQKCGFRSPDDAVVENLEVKVSEYYVPNRGRLVKKFRGAISYHVRCSSRHP